MKYRRADWVVGALLMIAGAQVAAAEEAGTGGAPDAGKTLFTERCGMCHQTNGMGVGILSRRTADPSKGLLEQRADLSSAVVRVVVRSGIGNMPRISRGEVSDPELATIALYLSKGKP
jgi:mono/diheme cytochrome c family protein